MANSLAVFLCLALTLHNVLVNAYDVQTGVVGSADVLLYQQAFTQAAIPGRVHTETAFYKDYVSGTLITAVHVKDNAANADGGYPNIVAGGVGQRYVKVVMKSQQSKALDFTVSVYGK